MYRILFKIMPFNRKNNLYLQCVTFEKCQHHIYQSIGNSLHSTACFLKQKVLAYIHKQRNSKQRKMVWPRLKWVAFPFSDSWLVSSGFWVPASAADSLRLAHMSYRLPANCIFLDSCLRDSHTTAASLGQPAIAKFAQSWNWSHDLQQVKFTNDQLSRSIS